MEEHNRFWIATVFAAYAKMDFIALGRTCFVHCILNQQTNARLWRQGQQSNTVVIHHIITKGTIDEQIMLALKKKDKTQTALINAVKAHLGGTHAEEIA